MHELVITRAHFQCGGLVAGCKIKFTTDEGEVEWEGMIVGDADPVAISVPGDEDGLLHIEHDRMCSVTIAHKEYLMSTIRHNFEQVKLKVKATGPCGKCGKQCSRNKTFWQTLNPFNTNPDGTAKTREQIHRVLKEQAAAYRTKTIYHAKCED